MTEMKTNASNSITIRVKLDHKPHILGELTACIGSLHGHIGAIDIVEATGQHTIRDFTIDASGEQHADQIVSAISALDGVEIVNYSDRTFLLHLGGKISMKSKTPLKTRDQLSMA